MPFTTPPTMFDAKHVDLDRLVAGSYHQFLPDRAILIATQNDLAWHKVKGAIPLLDHQYFVDLMAGISKRIVSMHNSFASGWCVMVFVGNWQLAKGINAFSRWIRDFRGPDLANLDGARRQSFIECEQAILSSRSPRRNGKQSEISKRYAWPNHEFLFRTDRCRLHGDFCRSRWHHCPPTTTQQDSQHNHCWQITMHVENLQRTPPSATQSWGKWAGWSRKRNKQKKSR